MHLLAWDDERAGGMYVCELNINRSPEITDAQFLYDLNMNADLMLNQ